MATPARRFPFLISLGLAFVCAACERKPGGGISDPGGSSRESGPSDKIVVAVFHETLREINEKAARSGRDPAGTGKELQIVRIERGDPLESSGAVGVPKGAWLFPVRIVFKQKYSNGQIIEDNWEGLYYQDSRKNWHKRNR